MGRKVKVFLAAAALALVAVVGGASASDPGVSSNSILIGGTFPLSGPASAYGTIASADKAYFDWFNSRSSIHGRKIDFKFYDDGYNPAQTVQLTRQLVEQDKVFAIFNALGTEPNLAIRDYLNQRKVPQALIATGASYWGTQWRKYPWTTGFNPDYVGEAEIYGKFILSKVPQAKVGILMQNDDYGKDYLRGFKKGLGAKGAAKIVDTEPYDVTQADVSQQMVKLKGSGANVLMVFATPKFSVQSFVIAAKIGWHPIFFVNNVSATASLMTAATKLSSPEITNGAISVAYTKDPADPKLANDRGIKLYKAIMAQYYPKGNVNDAFNLYGMTVAWTMVKALQASGKTPTRAGLMKALTHLNIKNNPFLLKGVVIKTSPTDRFLIQQGVLTRWQDGGFHNFGPLYSAK